MSENELVELVTGAELGRRLGVSRARAHQLAAQEGFPEPLGKVGQAKVWRWREVDAWAKVHRRKPEPAAV